MLPSPRGATNPAMFAGRATGRAPRRPRRCRRKAADVEDAVARRRGRDLARVTKSRPASSRVTPCTFGKRRSAKRSLATPFCTQKIGWSRDAGGAQPLERRDGVLRLHRQKDRVVGLEGELGGIGDAREPRRGAPSPACGAAARTARIAASCAPRAIPTTWLPGKRQRRRHRAADRADAVDDDSHDDPPGFPPALVDLVPLDFDA